MYVQCYQYYYDYYVDAALRSARRRLRLHNGAQRFGDVARFDQREPLRRADLILALLRDDACFKAQTVHLAGPLGKMVHAALLAGRAALAEGRDVGERVGPPGVGQRAVEIEQKKADFRIFHFSVCYSVEGVYRL